jgi:hypothetical protein
MGYVHGSNPDHVASVMSIMTRYNEASEDAKYEVKGLVKTKLIVPPKVRLLKNAFGSTGELFPEENNGIGRFQAGGGDHMAWAVEDFVLAPGLSLDPKWEYLNGKQMVGVGHAHLIVVKTSEYTQWKQWASGVAGVERPPSLREIGGHDWYVTDKIAEDQQRRFGSGTMISAPSFVGPFAVETDVQYEVIFYLVHIDDSRLDDFVHLRPVGDLQTRVVFVT